MDEKELLDKIRASSENVDATEKLQPENVKKRLEGRGEERKEKLRSYIQWAIIAVVFILVIIGLTTGLARVGGNAQEETTGTFVSGQEAQEGTQTEAN